MILILYLVSDHLQEFMLELGKRYCLTVYVTAPEKSNNADRIWEIKSVLQRLNFRCDILRLVEIGVGNCVVMRYNKIRDQSYPDRMKVFIGGRLFYEKTSPSGVAFTPLKCIHYALTRPGVSSILCGYDTMEHVEVAERMKKTAELFGR